MRLKVLFIDKDPVAKQGVMALCAFLKSNGFEADVMVPTVDLDVRSSIVAHSPGLIGFSCTTGRHEWANQLASEIRRTSSIPLVLGGPHATFFPEVLQSSPFDYLCRGEGEEPLLELVGALEEGDPERSIPNIWSKRNGQVFPGEVRSLVEDLDAFPYVDRTVYFKYKVVQDFHMDHFSFITGRGCPYSCTFCANSASKNLYKGKGRYVRKRSVENCIEDLLESKRRYPIRRLVFEDDTFILNEDWTLRFLEIYSAKVRLPFIGNARADQVTPEIVAALKRAGCTGVKMGVETGRESLRNEVLKKRISDHAYVEAARLLHAADIDIQSFNMVGIPGGSLEADWETVRFNRQLGVKHAWCSITNPYPRTEIMELAVQSGCLERQELTDGFFPESFFAPSKMRIPDRRQVANLHHLFNLCVAYPRLEPLLRFLIRLPLTRVYEKTFKFVHALYLKAFYRFRWRTYLKFLWYCRKMY